MAAKKKAPARVEKVGAAKSKANRRPKPVARKQAELAAGSTARLYRAGDASGQPVGQVVVPEVGQMVVRGLTPGAYVARDECGNEVGFEVDASVEVAVVQGKALAA